MTDPTQQPDAEQVSHQTQTPDQGPATPPAASPQPSTATQPEPTPPTEPTPSAQDTSELDALREQLAELERQRERDREQAQAEQRAAVASALARAGGQAPETTSTAKLDLVDLDQPERAEKYADWPQEGDERPQPWNLRDLGLHGASHDFDMETQPGDPNTVSPIVVNHGRPILAQGSTDPSVHELGQILGKLGFPNSVSEGRNAFGSVDNEVMGAVHAFRDAYNVQEDPSAWGGNTPNGRRDAAAHIGPWTWEAILRAGARVAGELVHR